MQLSWYQIRRSSFFVLMGLLSFSISAFAAQSGTVKGRVVDKDSKDILPGANVVVKNTNLGASTDVNGGYVIHNVPSGDQTLVVSYLGYVKVSIPVKVAEGEETQIDVALVPQAITGQTVIVTAQAQGQMQAINQQLASNTIVNVVSEAKIQELPDFNAAEAIGRLPGISTLRSSGEADKIVVRGMAPQYNVVSIDNITLSSTGKDDRSVDLTMISPYMLQSIDVYKALTPDMDANAIGGSVNMQLREAPSGLHSDLMWQSGYTAKNNVYKNYKALASVSDRFFDDHLGVYVLLNAEQYDRGADNFNASYKLDHDTRTPGLGYAPVSVSSMTLDRHIETRSRYGGNLVLDYRLPAGSISLINMASRLHSDYQDFQTNWDYIGHNLNFNFGAGKANTDVAVDALQGKYDFGFVAADISVANNYSRNFNPTIDNFQFSQGSGIYSTPVPSNVPPQSLISYERFNDTLNHLQQVGYNSADFKENDQTYSANFKVPFNFPNVTSGFFKVGGTHRHYVRNNDESAPYAGLRYSTNAIEQALIANPKFSSFLVYDPSAFGFYAHGFTSNDQSLYKSFLNNKYGNLIWAPQIAPLREITDFIVDGYSNSYYYYNGAYNNAINDYQYTEDYNAAYAMTELNFGTDLMVVGGARYENDKSDIIAYHVKGENNWTLEKATPDTAYPSNHFWLPMAQAKFSPVEWGDVRYAYSQTLARPNFTQLSPYENLDQNGQGVSAGNPHLRPAHSFNHDLMITVHSNDVGLVSVGAFYKTIEDFSYFIQYSLLSNNPVPGYDSVAEHPGAQGGAQIYTFYNNPYKAFVKGIEADLQTRFWYLPAPFDGLLLNVNYTHIKSNTYYPIVKTKSVPPVPPSRASTTVAYDSSRAGRLIFQPNDVLNASIGYDYAGFSGRISFLFQGNMVSSIAARSEQDAFTKDYFRIDATVRQKLPLEGLQLFLDVNNINQRTDISAQQTFGGSTSEIYYGLTADLGLRYTF